MRELVDEVFVCAERAAGELRPPGRRAGLWHRRPTVYKTGGDLGGPKPSRGRRRDAHGTILRVPRAEAWIPRLTFALLAGAAVALVATGGDFASAGPGLAPASGLAAGVAALVTLLLLERRFPKVRASPGRWFSERPRLAVVAAALAGTVLAMHPLFFGRSLVSPNTGGTAMLYYEPPFVPGSTAMAVESARGSDVGAMMWAILPYAVIQREAISQGEWPLWNRYNSTGEPLWGQAQIFALDPLHVASLLVPDVALAMDIRMVASRAIFAVGIGLVILALTRSAGAAALVALVTPFIGIYTMRLNHPAAFSLTYAPWILLAYTALAGVNREPDASAAGRSIDTRPGATPGGGSRADGARAAAGIAIASWLQMMGSTPKEGVMALVAMHMAGVIGVFLARRRWAQRLRMLDLLAFTAVAVILASAPYWLIFLDGLTRAYTAYDRPAAYLLNLSTVEAFLLGAARPGPLAPGIHALVAALVALGLLRSRSLWHHPVARGCLAATAAFWAVALGAVPESVLIRVPMLGNIHHLGMALAAASIPLALVIAGFGAAALLEPRSPRHFAVVAAAAAAIVAAVVIRSPALSPATLMALYSIAGAAAVILVGPLGGLGESSGLRLRGVSPAWVLAMAAGMGAAVITGGLALPTGNATLDAVLMQPGPRVDLRKVSPALGPVVEEDASGDPFRVAPLESVLIPGTQVYWGLEGIGGPDAVRLPFVEDLSDLAGVSRTPWLWLTVLDRQNLADAAGFLDLLNVRYLVTKTGRVPAGTTALPAPGEDLIGVVKRPTAWPRAFFVDGVERLSLFEFAARLRTAEQPFAAIDPTEAAAAAELDGLPTTASTVIPARDYRTTVNRTTFRVDATGPGVAALSEAYVDRDFVATLNGQPVPYIRVNHGFKGVRIPGAGTWDISFNYRPDLWKVSWLMAAAGWIGIAGLLVVGSMRGREVECGTT